MVATWGATCIPLCPAAHQFRRDDGSCPKGSGFMMSHESIPASNETSETFTGDCPSSSRMSLVQELLLMSAGSSVGAAVALDGRLDLTALAAAGQRLTARHELLRTVFGQVNGRPRQ